MLTEDYCDFETAKLLKDKGFPQSTFRCHYIIDGNVHYKSFENRCGFGDYDIIAPTLQMAMKWLREVHNIDVSIVPLRSHKEYLPRVEGDITSHDDIPCRKYEEACEAAIKYCLEHLI